MHIELLKITNLRNLRSVEIKPHLSFNFIYGENGSGKTSFLEAIYVLANNKSFRTSYTDLIICDNLDIKKHEDAAVVYSEVAYSNEKKTSQNYKKKLALKKQRNKEAVIKIDLKKSKPSDMARALVVLEVGPQSTELYLSGPQNRRRFMNWGLFHVEHGFYHQWQIASKALKQRNALLKKTKENKTLSLIEKKSQLEGDSEFIYWDKLFIDASLSIDKFRQDYTTALQGIFDEVFFQLTVDSGNGNSKNPEIEGLFQNLEIRYKKGWKTHDSLQDNSKNQMERDILMGYTQNGFHRADCMLYSQNKPINEVLSRGQVKIAIYALKLAQYKILQSVMNEVPICLLDDVSSELDDQHVNRVLQWLKRQSAQVFVTAINPLLGFSVENENIKMFHMERGRVVEVKG